jgi:hypothetical protein
MTVGLLLLAAAVLCAIGFVSATVRADARLKRVDPLATSTFRGVPAAWALLAIGCAVAAIVRLGAVVVAGP